MIEIFPISIAPKDETIIRGIFLTGERGDKGVQADCYWSERYQKWSWRNQSSFCRNAPDGWIKTQTNVF